jgi:hypothetical protein
MIAMLVFACLAGHQDQCRVIPVAAGFVSDEACKASKPLAPLALGWLRADHARHQAGDDCTLPASTVVDAGRRIT